MANFEVLMTSEESGDNFCISLWDVNSGMQLKAYKGGCCPSRCACLLGKDYIMASQVNKPIIHVWHTAKESVHSKLICPGKVTAVACSPGGAYCVAACGEKIYIWQVASGNLLALLSRHFQHVSCLKFTDDGSHFLSSGEDNLVLVWKMARILSLSSSTEGTFDLPCSPRHTWSDHALPVSDIHCGYGGTQGHVITSSLDQTCKLYDLSSGELLCSFVFDVGVTAVTMDSAEQNLFAGCTDGNIYQVKLFKQHMKDNVHTEKEGALIFHGHRKQVTSIAATMDGCLLLSGSEDQTACVWHVHSRQCLRVLNHRGAVTNAIIIPKPVYLDNAPPKSSLPSIQPFKRHVHVPKHSCDYHMTSHFDSTDDDSHSDGVPVVMRGTITKEDTFEHSDETKEIIMVHQIFYEMAKMEDQGTVSGEVRQLSRRELEEELQNAKRVNQKFYRFAVEELVKEVYRVGETDGT